MLHQQNILRFVHKLFHGSELYCVNENRDLHQGKVQRVTANHFLLVEKQVLNLNDLLCYYRI